MQHRIALLLFCVLTQVACYQTLQTSTGTSFPRLTDLPSPAHTNNIALFLNGERPSEPYLHICVFSRTINQASERGLNDLIGYFKGEAQQQGADAIMVSNEGTIHDPTFSTFDNSSILTTYQAVAIKYIRNINYLDNYVREKRVFNPKDSLIGTVEIGFDQKYQRATCPKANYLLLRRYDLSQYFSARQINSLAEYPASVGKTPWIRPSAGYDQMRVFRFSKGSKTGKILLVEIKNIEDSFSKNETVQYTYDKEGRCTQRIIKSNSDGKVLEEIRYDPSTGKPTGSTFSRLLPNDAKEMLFRVENVYYIKDDLTQFKSEFKQ